MLKCRKRGLKMSRFTHFFSGKFLDVRKYACVKDLTNIMSAQCYAITYGEVLWMLVLRGAVLLLAVVLPCIMGKYY